MPIFKDEKKAKASKKEEEYTEKILPRNDVCVFDIKFFRFVTKK
jgi:hypothetical protein